MGNLLLVLTNISPGVNYTDNKIVNRVIKIVIIAVIHVYKKLSEMLTI